MESLLQGLTGLNPFSVMIRMVIAVFSGAVIGYGRGQRRSAGMKTHAMVCLGACLVMCAGEYVAEVYGGSDVTRLGAQVISGIGFLGAGTIIKAPGNKIWGLTTASGLWCSACLGLAVGIGFYWGGADCAGRHFSDHLRLQQPGRADETQPALPDAVCGIFTP